MKISRKHFAAFAAVVLCAAPLCAKPKLVVVISVDQMRADYLDRFGREFTGGFSRLLREGAVFTQARYHQIPTETAVGHATISTGRTPSEHGIVGNNWLDRETRKMVYAVEDSAYGRSPAKLLCDTIGDALKAQDSEAKVAAFSGKDRAAIMLAGRRANAVLWYERDNGDFESSKYYGPFPDWAAAFNRRREADRRFRELYPQNSTAIPTSFYYELTLTSTLDELTERIAAAGLKSLKLGADLHPDLLFIGFSATDIIGHRYGSESPEIKSQMLGLDRILGDLFEELDKRVGKKNYAVVLTADHGIMTHPESPAGQAKGARRLLANDFNRRFEAALEKQFPIPAGSKMAWTSDFYPPQLYLNDRLAASLEISWDKFLAGAADVIRGLPEVAAVYSPAIGSDLGVSLSSATAIFQRSYYAPRSGDLVVMLKDNFMFTHDATDSHGSPYDEDSNVPLVFWGNGIKEGRYRRPVDVTDIAPTIGRILEFDYPARPGSVSLDEVFMKGKD